jgi:hypothetical protein
MSREIPKAIIRHIVGNLHVSTTNRAVIADLRGRFAGPEQWPKARRKAAYRYAIKVHEDNRALYRSVMGGTF